MIWLFQILILRFIHVIIFWEYFLWLKYIFLTNLLKSLVRELTLTIHTFNHCLNIQATYVSHIIYINTCVFESSPCTLSYYCLYIVSGFDYLFHLFHIIHILNKYCEPEPQCFLYFMNWENTATELAPTLGHKLEFLALKWAVTEKFHDYLYG